MAYDLQLSQVGKVYENGTPAVIDFNLDVSKGEFIAFLGPSGCGKTTTLRMIAGFESITSGNLMIRGRLVNELSPEKRPTSMIFQNYALFPHMTVRQNVRFGLDVKGMPDDQAKAKVDRILEKLDLTAVADVRPTRLSGGQRQRIALARSLVVEPDILLLDEPLGALDANLRKSIQNELKLLQKELGITFVFVTHAQSEALALSDRIVVMNAGRIEQVSPPRELYTRPRSIFVARFIGANTLIPGTLQGLSAGVATLDTALGAVAGLAPDGAAATPGTQASLVLPAESVTIVPVVDRASLPAATCAVPCRVGRLQLVGHILTIGVDLPDGSGFTIEGHVDKYRGRLEQGMDALVTWAPEGATVIL